MTARRRSMRACLQLRGLAERTQDRDVRAVRPLAEPYRTAPDVIRAADRRHSCRDRQQVKPDSRRASTSARGGRTCCFEPTLPRAWPPGRGVRAPREPTRPGLLRLAAVRTRLGGVRRPRDRVCRTTIDAWPSGVRRGPLGRCPSVIALVCGSTSVAGRAGQRGAGPWPHPTRARRRQSWGTPRHPVRCPAAGRGGIVAPAPARPRRRGQGACRAASTSAVATPTRLGPRGGLPGPRLGLEAGVTPAPPVDLGHHAPTTPRLSTPLTASADPRGADAINRRRRERCGASADIGRRHGPAYCAPGGGRRLPRPRRALQEMARGRTRDARRPGLARGARRNVP